MKKFINLLPPEEQRQIQLERANHQIIKFGIWLLASLLAMMAILLTDQLLLSQTLRTSTDQVAVQRQELQRIQGTSIQKEAETLNASLKNFQSLAKQDLKFSPYLIEFAKLLPHDVTIDTFAINRSTRKVEVTGRAGTRDSILELRQNILASEFFENINFPLDNLESARDVSWKYKFYIHTARPK